MRNIDISQWCNVSEVNLKRRRSRGAKRSSSLFMSILILFSGQWIAGCGIRVLLYCRVSVSVWFAHLVLTLIKGPNIHKRRSWPVSLLHRHHRISVDWFIICLLMWTKGTVSLFCQLWGDEARAPPAQPFHGRREEQCKIYSWRVRSHSGEGSHNITSARW